MESSDYKFSLSLVNQYMTRLGKKFRQFKNEVRTDSLTIETIDFLIDYGQKLESELLILRQGIRLPETKNK
jgi:hypothetical protein